jgi:hypothetical protein
MPAKAGLNAVFNTLLKQGIAPDVATKILQRLPGTKRDALGTVFSGIGTIGGGLGIATSVPEILKLFTGGSANAATSPPPASSTGSYMLDPATDISYEDRYRREMFNRALAESIPFLNIDLGPAPMSPEEFRAANEARRQREAESLSARELEKISRQRGFDVTIENIAKAAQIEQARLEAEALIRAQELASAAEMRKAELTGLANVQQERLKSSYGLAQGVLENAIQNILQSGTITARPVEVELAEIK